MARDPRGSSRALEAPVKPPRSVVVDASVAVKWVIAEDLSDRAVALYEAGLASRLPSVVPPHFASEVVNAIYRRSRRKVQENQIPENRAKQVAEAFLKLRFRAVAPRGLYSEAFSFAVAHRQSSIYDALYVVLAGMLGVDFWTADLTLLRVVGPTAPWMRWIGEFEA